MRFSLRVILAIAVLAVLALVPVIAKLTATPYLMTLLTRVVILAIAATSLNFILGYGGMISFGHAVYIGLGAYVVGIMAYHEVYSAFVQWPVAILVSAGFALVVGALCLRTRGVYFIMITLAFSQMVYFLAVGLSEYGGDDGLTIYQRSTVGGWLNLADRTTFYYVCYGILLLCLLLMWRMTHSHFGMVIRAAKSNEPRLQALGLATYPYRLTAFVISGAICGLAGVLLANHTDFVNPELMHWTRSGDLMIMVILGGLGTWLGPIVGTVALLALEDLLAGITEYWQIVLGPLLVLMALFKQGGIIGLIPGGRRE